MDSEEVNELPPGWKLVKKPKEQKEEVSLPAGWKLKPKEEKPKRKNAFTGEEMSEEEYENLNWLEKRAHQMYEEPFAGPKALLKGLASGATFGLTEHPEVVRKDIQRTREFLSNLTGVELPGKTPEQKEALGEQINLAIGEEEPGLEAETGRFLGSLLPLSKIFNFFGAPIQKMAAKSPYMQRTVSALGDLLTAGLTGATTKGAEQLVQKGEIDPEEVLEHGAEWVAFDAALKGLGLGGKFANYLYRKGTGMNMGPYKVLKNDLAAMKELGIDIGKPEEVNEYVTNLLKQPLPKVKPELPAMENIAVPELAKQKPITAENLRTKKISDETMKRLGEESMLRNATLPEKVNLAHEAEVLEKTALTNKIESVSNRAISDEGLGLAIKGDVEAQLAKDQQGYEKLYKESEKVAQESTTVPRNTANYVTQKFHDLLETATQAPGTETVINKLKDVLKDIGYEVKKTKQGYKITPGNEPVPVRKLQKMAINLNKSANWENLEPSVKDIVKKVASHAKQDVRNGLRHDPNALAAFELAEEEFGRVAKKYGTDTMRGIRTATAGEKIAKIIKSPSSLGELKSTLSTKQFAQIEREILEHLNDQSYEAAKKQFRNIQNHMTESNRKLAREIVEFKNPHNPTFRKKLAKEAILEDLANSITTGNRPEKTLKLWKNTKGQKIVKEALKDSPNWPQVKNYLENESFNELINSVVKNGELDAKKLKNLMKDPEIENNIRHIAGEDGVRFFRNLDSEIQKFEKNVKLLDRLPKEAELTKGKELAASQTRHKGKGILKRMAQKDFPLIARTNKWMKIAEEATGFNGKQLLGMFGLYTGGVTGALGLYGSKRIMNSLLHSSKARNMFRKASRSYNNPVAFILAMENLVEAIEEEENREK